MAPQHPPRFLKIVDEAKGRIRQTDVDSVKEKIDQGIPFVLVDLGKGVIERDIEGRVPKLDTPLILYCGGGFRSALAADNLQKMGYTDVLSMDGGIREWREKGYPLTKA
jgi:rhodanese-related sulfurtransferase